MTVRKRLRRRNAIRALLQNLEIRPFCEDAEPVSSGGWLSQPRPRFASSARATIERSSRDNRR
jgi:hypothetical protein